MKIYNIKCSGEIHRIGAEKNGAIFLLDHDIEAEKVAAQLGASVPDCLTVAARLEKGLDQALEWFVETGASPWLVALALELGADPKVDNNYCLHTSAASGDVAVVAWLLLYGADVRSCNDFALRYAAKGGHLKTVKLLLKYGADVHADDDFALRYARSDGHTEIVRYLEKWITEHPA